MRLRLDVFFILAGASRFLSVLPEEGVEAQAVERAEVLVALVEASEIELWRAKALACGFVEDRSHLCQKIGAGDLFGLGGLVALAVVVQLGDFFNRRVARGDVAVLGRSGRGAGAGKYPEEAGGGG